MTADVVFYLLNRRVQALILNFRNSRSLGSYQMLCKPDAILPFRQIRADFQKRLLQEGNLDSSSHLCEHTTAFGSKLREFLYKF